MKKNGILWVVAAALVVGCMPAAAVELLSDNFEPVPNPYGGTTPDVSTYTLANTSGQANTILWARATSGFGSTRNGLVDETENGGANFTDPTGTQAYAFRYTNSGVTTQAGKIGALTAGITYTVTFDVVKDGFNTGLAYDAYLVLFDAGAVRTAVEQGVKNTAAVLKRVTGNAPSDGSYQTVTFTYTAGDPVVDNNGATAGVSTTFLTSLLGKDIALRFDGQTTCANIDNVVISDNFVPDTTPPTLASSDIVDDSDDGTNDTDFGRHQSAHHVHRDLQRDD